MAQQKVRLSIPRSLGPDKRIQLGLDVINYIQERSAAGRDKNEDKFPKYTKQYAELKGVGRGEVDLILSGEMLLSLELLKEGPGFIEIGYERGDPNNDKAEGNILGSYGREPDPSKARDFLGIDETVLEILADTLDEEREIEDVDIDQIAEEEARKLIEDLDFDREDF